MDAHMEVNIHWLQPLVVPILKDYKTITQPSVGWINSETFAIDTGKAEGNRGAFDWGLTYYELEHPKRDDKADNFKVPVLLGAIMAMNKSYFWELGGYDEKLEIWGGEQYEASLHFTSNLSSIFIVD